MSKQQKGTHRNRVEEWHKPDPKNPFGLFEVKLKPGFAFTPNRDIRLAVHNKCFETARDAKAAVIASLPCNCDRCACPSKKVA